MALSKTRKILILLSLAIGAFALLGGFTVKSYRTLNRFLSDGENDPNFATDEGNVAVLEIRGIIMDSRDALKSINELDEKDSVKAVVIRIDSPGGAVGPSQEIYEAVKELRTKKKVVCSMGDLAASGGYYIAMGCEKIVANAGTLTGSIGVIMQFMNMKELYAWAKVDPMVIKAGHFKDIGSTSRAMTEEEKGLLQKLIDDVHTQFKHAVEESRGFKPGYIDTYGDGRIFTGQQAKELGFVDVLGGENAAVKLAAEMAGIKGKPKVLRENNRKDRISRFLEGKLNDSQRVGIESALQKVLPQLNLMPGVPYLLPAHMFGGRP